MPSADGFLESSRVNEEGAVHYAGRPLQEPREEFELTTANGMQQSLRSEPSLVREKEFRTAILERP